jgi:hypothetical protein
MDGWTSTRAASDAAGVPSRLVRRKAVSTATPALPAFVGTNDATGVRVGRSTLAHEPVGAGLFVASGPPVGLPGVVGVDVVVGEVEPWAAVPDDGDGDPAGDAQVPATSAAMTVMSRRWELR